MNETNTRGSFKQRRRELAAWFRVLEMKYPGDPMAQRAHANDIEVSSWSFWKYRQQSKMPNERINGGIPNNPRYGNIIADLELMCAAMNLSKDGKLKKGSLSPVERIAATEAKKRRTQDAEPKSSFTRQPALPIAALREGSDPSPLQIVRSLMNGMDKASLKVVSDHAWELGRKE